MASIKHESTTILSFLLTPTDGTAVEPPDAGQYLTLRLRPAGPDQPSVIRSYSLSSVAGRDGYRISIKLEPHGVGSKFLHKQVDEGDVIDVAAPRGSFLLRDRERPVVLISAGIGATPVVAMLQTLAAARSVREIWWLHGARNSDEHPFSREVDQLLKCLPHHHRLVAYSRPLPTDVAGSAFDGTGRLGIELIEAARVPVDADYYLCGPDGFMRAISLLLLARGVPPEQVAMEIFGGAPSLTPGVVGGERRPPHERDRRPGPVQ